MASSMCVDVDINSNSEEPDAANGGSDQDETKLDVMRKLEREIGDAKAKGDGKVRWLELDGFRIDDDTLLSLDLFSKFPVRNHCLLNPFVCVVC